MKKQDELTRRRRLNRGCCPTHGTPLVQCGLAYNESNEVIGLKVKCPRKDCSFVKDVKDGSKLMKVLEEKING